MYLFASPPPLLPSSPPSLRLLYNLRLLHSAHLLNFIPVSRDPSTHDRSFPQNLMGSQGSRGPTSQ
eukprot:753185-Hanusia_phi.AAC.1